MIISGTFNLPASANWAQSQTRRVQLDADTTGAPVTVNLPDLADVLAVGGEGVEIIVNDVNGNAGANNITLVANAGAGDTIEGASNQVISVNDTTVILKVGSAGSWATL